MLIKFASCVKEFCTALQQNSNTFNIQANKNIIDMKQLGNFHSRTHH